MRQVTIDYFTDVLCIWAYGGQIGIDRLKTVFGPSVVIQQRFVPVFGSARDHVRHHGPDEDGYINFSEHLKDVAASWDHVRLHPELWLTRRPHSSLNAHLYLKAVQLLIAQDDPRPDPPALDALVWQVRCAFFQEGKNIGHCNVLDDLAQAQGFEPGRIRQLIETGQAQAALHRDTEAKEKHQVSGSPTLIMNDGRQRIYGNVGYRIIEANIKEMLHRPEAGEASWC